MYWPVGASDWPYLLSSQQAMVLRALCLYECRRNLRAVLLGVRGVVWADQLGGCLALCRLKPMAGGGIGVGLDV